MATHLTPTELARELGIERRQVLATCVENGVPIVHGEIDRTLFAATQRERAAAAASG